jgi:Fe-S cluster biogenesis protein NfuA
VADVAEPELLLERVQELSEAVDELPDPRARELASDLVSSVIAMYGDGLERIVAAIGDAGAPGDEILDRLTQDGAVASLLLIHDLYPVDLHGRVLEALDTVRPYMESHGGNVELVSLDDGVARLALRGSCNGCSASRATLEQAIEQALAEHAPDLIGLEVTGVVDATPAPGAPPPTPAPGGGCELPMAPPQAFELPMVQSIPPASPTATPAS